LHKIIKKGFYSFDTKTVKTDCGIYRSFFVLRGSTFSLKEVPFYHIAKFQQNRKVAFYYQRGLEMNSEKKILFLKTIKALQSNVNSENKRNFFKALKDSVFWVPVSIEEEEKKENYALLVSSDGGFYIPAFFEKEDVAGPFTGKKLKCVSYNYLKHMVIDDAERLKGIAISPFKENIIISQSLIYAADESVDGMTVNKEEHIGNVRLWKPNQIPNGLVGELKRLFRSKPEIDRAWLLIAQGQAEEGKHWLLLIDFYGDKKILFPQIDAGRRLF